MMTIDTRCDPRKEGHTPPHKKRSFSPLRVVSPFVVVPLIVAALLTTPTAADAARVTICTNNYLPVDYLHIEYATRNSSFAAAAKARYFPSLDVELPVPIAPSYDPLVAEPPGSSIARALILHGGDRRCSLFIGPSYNAPVGVLEPIMTNALWIDPRSRAVPTVSGAAPSSKLLRTAEADSASVTNVMAFLKVMRWRNVGLMSSSDPATVTWAESFSAAAAAGGVTVRASYNIPLSPDRVAQILSSQYVSDFRAKSAVTRVMVVGGSHMTALAAVAATPPAGASEIIFVFVGETICGAADQAWRRIRPSVCIHATGDVTMSRAYATEFAARPEARFRDISAYLRPYRYPAQLLNTSRNLFTNISTPYLIDATLFGLHTLQRFLDANGRLPRTSEEGSLFVRSLAGSGVQQSSAALSSPSLSSFSSNSQPATGPITIQGLTGTVTVGEDGLRVGCVLTRFLFLGAGETTPRSLGEAGINGASWDAGSNPYVTLFNTNFSFPPQVGPNSTWEGPADRVVDPSAPPDVEPTAPPEGPIVVGGGTSSVDWWVFLLIGLGAAAAAALVGLVAVAYRRLAAARGAATRYAPKDSAQPVAIAFTDIQSSTALWAECPAEMSAALDLHNTIIRQCIAAHKGYEVKTIGDSFMVAFASPSDAVEFGVSVQRRLFHADWATAVEGENAAAVLNAFYASSRPGEAAAPDEWEAAVSAGGGAFAGGAIRLRGEAPLPGGAAAVPCIGPAPLPPSSLRAPRPEASGEGAGEQRPLAPHTRVRAKPKTVSVLLFNGLRVRVGISYGLVSIARIARDRSGRTLSSVAMDATAKGKGDGDDLPPGAVISYDYYGHTVGTAALLEAVGHGGQVLATEALIDAAREEASAERSAKGLSDSDAAPQRGPYGRRRPSTATNAATVAANASPQATFALPNPLPQTRVVPQSATAAVSGGAAANASGDVEGTSAGTAVFAESGAFGSVGLVPTRPAVADSSDKSAAPLTMRSWYRGHPIVCKALGAAPTIAKKAAAPSAADASGVDASNAAVLIFEVSTSEFADRIFPPLRAATSAAVGGDVGPKADDAQPSSVAPSQLMQADGALSTSPLGAAEVTPSEAASVRSDVSAAAVIPPSQVAALLRQVAARRGHKEGELRMAYFMVEALLSVLSGSEAAVVNKLLLGRWHIDASRDGRGYRARGSAGAGEGVPHRLMANALLSSRIMAAVLSRHERSYAPHAASRTQSQ